MFKKGFLLLAMALAAGSIAACTEKLDSGRSCPLLCPEQAITLVDTTIDAVVSDTTIAGLPPIGTETYLMLASHGDTLDTRVIVRFDTLPQNFTLHNVSTDITAVDSATLLLPIIVPDSLHRPKGPITIQAYDVDTTATDTVSSILGSLFRADRLLGSQTFAADSLTDTLRIPIATDTVLDRVVNAKKLRVGFRLVTSRGFDLQIGSTSTAVPVTLQIKAARDTGAVPVLITPLSNTPLDQTFLAGPLADYSIVLKGLTTTPVTQLTVGGVPSRRVFFHFDVPSRIVDSTTIVRASLLLTQIPNRRLAPTESVYVYPVAVLASPTVTSVGNLLQFLGATGQYGLDSIRVAPADSGVRSFEIAGLARTWRNTALTVSPRSIALRSGAEGQLPAQIDFYSTKAPAGLRPRLRITYVPQTNYGVP